MSSRKNENWLLVEWSSGGRDVVYVRSVLSPVAKELKIGDNITVNRRGEPQPATLLARAQERHQLDSKIKEKDEAETNLNTKDEPGDFSSSASSWEPSDDGASSCDGDSVKTKNKKIKLDSSVIRQYSNRRTSRKVLTPIHRANAVIPKGMQLNTSNNTNFNRKRAHKEIAKHIINKSMADSTKRTYTPQTKVTPTRVSIDISEVENIKKCFQMLFKMIDEIKGHSSSTRKTVVKDDEPQLNTIIQAKGENDETLAENEQEIENDQEEFNRSDDNVLITNKYDNIAVDPVTRPPGVKEWVPIGSGMTLIHINQFKKVNWKSYTIATRTLLLAAFPRRILATHSLTGKRSPAFQNKPAKMCLDPKIISDVIMEIMDRFNVKENLVRSIITTKCADECKMFKMRATKKKSNNQENETPTTSNANE